MKKSLLSILVVLIAGILPAAGQSHFYDEQPDPANCKAGVIKQAEKDKVIQEINLIRAVHHLKPVVYNTAFDEIARESALIQSTNDEKGLDHEPANSYKCWTQAGYDGSKTSNLFISWSSGNSAVPTENSIGSWMVDQYSSKVGHRRWIIDPFLRHVAVGRADGPSTKYQGWTNSAITLICIDRDNEQNVSDWDYDFVAYPYHNYKPRWVYYQDQDKNTRWHYLSFTYIADKSSGYMGNKDVSFANTQITMKDEDDNPVTIVEQIYDNDGYGTPNCLKWMPNKLDPEKKYYVEIKNVMSGGQSKDFSYWFEITEDEYNVIPDIPTPDFPKDGSKNIAVDIAFSWNKVPSADDYHLKVATDAEMTNLIIDEEGLTENYFTVKTDLDNDATYYWQVDAGNDAGRSDFSPVATFETKSAGVTDVVILLEPENNAGGVSITPTIKWEALPGADSYFLIVAPDPDPANYSGWDGISTTESDNKYEVDEGELEMGTQYWWVVRAEVDGEETKWSETWTFTVTSGEDMQVELIEPEHNAEQVIVTPTLKWNEVEGADSYEIEIANKVSMESDNLILTKQNYTETEYTVPESFLSPSRPYFWRVRAVKSGSAAEWSDIWKFITAKDENLVPKAVYPADEAVSIPTTLTLEWTAIDIAESYNLQIYNDETTTASNLVFDETGLTTNTFTIPEGTPLADDHPYYWMIQAVDDDTEGSLPWSYTYSFTTADEWDIGAVFDLQLSEIQVGLYPNPAETMVTLSMNIPNVNTVTVGIYNANGTKVGMLNLGKVARGEITTSLDVSGYAPGTYFWRMSAEDGTRTGRFIVIR